jgi:hypothetical protein
MRSVWLSAITEHTMVQGQDFRITKSRNHAILATTIRGHDKIHINQNVLCNIWKQTLKSELKIFLTANCNDTIDKAKILTILSIISK